MRLSTSCLVPCLRSCLASRARFWIALAVSFCAHLIFLFPPHWIMWQSPRPLPEISRLNVTLKKPVQPAQPLPPPAPAVVPPTPPTPPQTATPISAAVPVDEPPPAPIEMPPVEASPETKAMDEAVRTDEYVIAAPEEVVVVAPGGTMRYIVYRGDQGFEVGRAQLQWELYDGRYRLNLHTETSGVVGLLYPVAADVESRGHLGAEGLIPDRYTLTPLDKNPDEVYFNWEIGQMEMRASDPRAQSRQRPQPVHPGSQDILSLQFQFAYLLAPVENAIGKSVAIWVTNDKRYEQIRFEVLGEEVLELPAGVFPTLHLQSVGGNKKIDFWLTNNYQMLPVKTRFTDKKGDIYEQAVSEIVIDNDASAPSDADADADPEAPLSDIPIDIPPE
ncbi:hypothetical protein AGMMS49545_10130 [Betaproteobacteria bacterium]|nr:hypothetical protein AGMMS49545_10130 [Betaproteobacteria bacterium]GHU41481.1 hypothetical protein AGMMS50289_04680 [Betaproteobacteria bacterium]